MKCGLLGQRLGHSYSPQIHDLLGSYSYSLYEKEPHELEEFLKHGDYTGLNVTIPYKKSVIPFCDELTPTAKRLGAVNTIVRTADGRIVGHNTDRFGFSYMLRASNAAVNGKKALVLGSGGASNTVCDVLKEAGAEVIVISRNGPNNYENLYLHRDCALLVNATPVGMYPQTGVSPVDLHVFPSLECVLDLIYNPARTQLGMDAERKGIPFYNGLGMLVAQAKESAEWFLGHRLPERCIADIQNKLQKQTENIILIGMPGCGKSTIGKQLAQATGKAFVDADTVLEQMAQMTIPKIFETEGEAGFRRRETAVLDALGKGSGQVIATGGGCVTRPENYPLLHQNGIIIYIRRAVTNLPTNGRPLSRSGSLDAMYKARAPLYQQFADQTINNCGSIKQAVNAILTALEDT